MAKEGHKYRLTVILILLAYLALSIVYWLISDVVADWAIHASPILVTVVNFLLNPFYVGSFILIFELFFRGFKLERNVWNSVRVAFASILLSLSLDIFSLIHSFRYNCTLLDPQAVSIYFDTIIGKPICSYFVAAGNPMLGTFIIYVSVAFIMAILALFIASPKDFVGLVKGQVGH